MSYGDWSSDVCSFDVGLQVEAVGPVGVGGGGGHEHRGGDVGVDLDRPVRQALVPHVLHAVGVLVLVLERGDRSVLIVAEVVAGGGAGGGHGELEPAGGHPGDPRAVGARRGGLGVQRLQDLTDQVIAGLQVEAVGPVGVGGGGGHEHRGGDVGVDLDRPVRQALVPHVLHAVGVVVLELHARDRPGGVVAEVVAGGGAGGGQIGRASCRERVWDSRAVGARRGGRGVQRLQDLTDQVIAGLQVEAVGPVGVGGGVVLERRSRHVSVYGDWSVGVCSADLVLHAVGVVVLELHARDRPGGVVAEVVAGGGAGGG